MNYYVYMTLNIINYKWYIGITKKPKESGYIGSGRYITKAITKYGKEFFVRHDVFVGTREEASEMEKQYIVHYDAVISPDFYNLREGGYDGQHGDSSKLAMSIKCKAAWERDRARYLESFARRDYSKQKGKHPHEGKLNPMYGKTHSSETKVKLSQMKKGIKMNHSPEKISEMKSRIKSNAIMMGPKTDKQKARNRWAALKKTFSKDPVVAADLDMMHVFYGFKDAVKKLPKEHQLEYLKFRYRFLQEELTEGTKAIDDKNPEEVVDSLVDLMVVAMGTLDLYGIDFKKAWYTVLAANMNKEPGVKASRPNPWGLPDLIKKSDWVPPSHANNHGLIGDILK